MPNIVGLSLTMGALQEAMTRNIRFDQCDKPMLFGWGLPNVSKCETVDRFDGVYSGCVSVSVLLIP